MKKKNTEEELRVFIFCLYIIHVHLVTQLTSKAQSRYRTVQKSTLSKGHQKRTNTII